MPSHQFTSIRNGGVVHACICGGFKFESSNSAAIRPRGLPFRLELQQTPTYHSSTCLTSPYSYGLFKAADKKLLSSDNLAERLNSVEKITKE